MSGFENRIHLHEDRTHMTACHRPWKEVDARCYLRSLSEVDCPECLSSDFYKEIFARQSAKRSSGKFYSNWELLVNPSDEDCKS